MTKIDIKEIGLCEICQKEKAVILYRRTACMGAIRKTFLVCRDCCQIVQKEILNWQ